MHRYLGVLLRVCYILMIMHPEIVLYSGQNRGNAVNHELAPLSLARVTKSCTLGGKSKSTPAILSFRAVHFSVNVLVSVCLLCSLQYIALVIQWLLHGAWRYEWSLQIVV